MLIKYVTYARPIDYDVVEKILLTSPDDENGTLRFINHCEMSGKSALAIACDRKDMFLFKMLIDYGADVNWKDG